MKYAKRKPRRLHAGKYLRQITKQLGWHYSHYRASLYLDGKHFAIVTPDATRALTKKNATLLLEALNRK